MADNERILNGEDVSTTSVNEVKELPDNFTKWMADNQERIDRAKSVPYFIKDNKGYFDKAVNKKPFSANGENGTNINTSNVLSFVESSKATYNNYSDDWIKAYFNEKTGGFNVYHKQHQFSKTKAKGASMTGGEAEKYVGRIMADKGEQVEFLAENGKNKGKPDLHFSAKTWDVKYISMANKNTIRQYYKDARKAECVIFFSDVSDRSDDIIAAVNRENGRYKSLGRDTRKLPDVYVLKSNGDLELIIKNKGG